MCYLAITSFDVQTITDILTMQNYTNLTFDNYLKSINKINLRFEHKVLHLTP